MNEDEAESPTFVPSQKKDLEETKEVQKDKEEFEFLQKSDEFLKV